MHVHDMATADSRNHLFVDHRKIQSHRQGAIYATGCCASIDERVDTALCRHRDLPWTLVSLVEPYIYEKRRAFDDELISSRNRRAIVKAAFSLRHATDDTLPRRAMSSAALQLGG